LPSLSPTHRRPREVPLRGCERVIRSRAMRASGYVRVSTARQESEGFSLAEQEKQVRAYIDLKGWTLDKIYVEGGVSGRRNDRPELVKLLSNLGGIDVLVIPKLDRLGRNTKHLHQTYEQLEQAKVSLVSLKESIDTTTPVGKLLRNILSSLAEFESDQTKERVESVTIARAEKGKKHAAWPYGYVEGKPVEPAASIVRRIFEETRDGKTQRQIANKLNAEGIKTPKGKTWKQTQIKSALDCVTYTGRIETNGVIYDAEHKAIVSKDLWDKVQGLRAANKRGKNGSSAGRTPLGNHLFRKGFLRCAHCGAAMVTRTVPNKGGSMHESYVCHTRMSNGEAACPILPIPRKLLDEAMFDYFARVCADIEATKDELESRVAAAEVERKAKLAEAKAKLTTLATADERLQADYLAAKIDGENYSTLTARIKTEAAEAKASLAKQESLSPAEPQAVADTAALIAALRAEVAGEVSAAAGLDGIRARLGLLFERFEVGMPAEGEPLTALESTAVAAVAAADESDGLDAIDADKWVLVPVPRGEWMGELSDYWHEVLRPMALPINEQAGVLRLSASMNTKSNGSTRSSPSSRSDSSAGPTRNSTRSPSPARSTFVRASSL
jgi:site-specific DNA recombinase